MISKKLLDLQDQIDLDFNLAGTELDSHAKRLRYIAASDLTSVEQKDAFDNFWNDVKQNQAAVLSLNQNADVYDVGYECFVIVMYEDIKTKCIIFDIEDAKKIEKMIFD